MAVSRRQRLGDEASAGVTRRAALTTFALSLAGLALAGCGGASSGSAAVARASSSAPASSAAVSTSTAIRQAATSAVTTTSAIASAASSASSTTSSATTASEAARAASGAPVTIEYFYQADNLWPKDKLMLEPFMAQHPDITVTGVSPGTNFDTKLHAMIAGGTPPDTTWMNDIAVPALVDEGAVLAADSYLDRDWTAMDGGDIYPGAWDAVKWQGKRYGTPFEDNPFLPVFRPDFFDAASVPYPTIQAGKGQWNWAAVVDTATKLTKRGPDGQATQFGIQLRTDPYSLLHWIWNNGGQMWNADRTQCLLNQPAAVDAVQFMQDFFVKSRTAPTGDEVLKLSGVKSNNMLSGVIAMEWQYSGGGSLMGGVVKFPFMCAPEPQGKVTPIVPHSNGSGNGMVKGTKHADAAWEWVKFLVGKDADQIMMKTGRTPPRRQSGEAYYIKDVKYPTNPKVVTDMLRTARMTPAVAAWADFSKILGQQLAPVWTGRSTPQDALNEVVRLVNPLLQTKQ
jgi:ABC-type glycerol-3-phosphate transport system substrate-binding protein